ncbi:unnamed protein product [Sphenostylis stenocarpa]|uniref:Uncharacterized protein n=1 Tax=Sphenostylis stenocarpa TaxID=92480 RepID=A0AA86SDL4_9FABA|nr:unnamed protein product [Sphenostylis stenocarpa]
MAHKLSQVFYDHVQPSRAKSSQAEMQWKDWRIVIDGGGGGGGGDVIVCGALKMLRTQIDEHVIENPRGVDHYGHFRSQSTAFELWS